MFGKLFSTWKRNEKGYVKPSLEISNIKLLILTALFLVLFDNFSFFRHVREFYPFELKNIPFLFSLAVMLVNAIMILFTLLCFKYTTKPILIIILIASSLASYFMNNYNVIIDNTMIQNIMETNRGETSELLNVKLFYYLFFAGILPSIVIYMIKIRYKSFMRQLFFKLITFAVVFIITIISVFSLSNYYASFFRDKRSLRCYSNPTYYVYSSFKYFSNSQKTKGIKVKPIGTDAKISEDDKDRELIILVVGETARADRFSLNGYRKETNPLLKKEDIINFPKMYSCGTATGVTVPLMFSNLSRKEYTDKKAKSQYNILDILNIAGVNVLWRENNSDSKGVALRVPFEEYKYPPKNTICNNVECRDEGMLIGLKEYIESKKTGDILIVLHQMGNHGPAYYKRYPETFERFKPVCKTNQLEKCTREEIDNAYDNAILYTDYFLSKVIDLLKQNNQFETAMFYIGDHGESLGENNLYLHGFPYFMAPKTQLHIPAVMWFGDNFKINKEILKKDANKNYSQENLFHTLLGLFEVKTSLYDRNKDIINSATDINLAINR